MTLTPQRKRELLIAAGVLGGLIALLVLRNRNANSTSTVGPGFDPSTLLSSGGGFDPSADPFAGDAGDSGFTVVTPTDPSASQGGGGGGGDATVTPTTTTTTTTTRVDPLGTGAPAPSPLTIAGGLDPAIATRVAAGPPAPSSAATDTGGAARTQPTSSVAKATPKPAPKPAAKTKPVSGYSEKSKANLH